MFTMWMRAANNSKLRAALHTKLLKTTHSDDLLAVRVVRCHTGALTNTGGQH